MLCCFSHVAVSTKDETLPFPWQTNQPVPEKTSITFAEVSTQQKRYPPDVVEQSAPSKRKLNPNEDLPSSRLKTLSAECQKLGCIALKLCHLNAVAGAILRHAISNLENLFRQEEPLIFKIGFTHNPIWRWSNETYGYKVAREKWTNMIILHYAKEPYGPAMLEASLIEKFQSIYTAQRKHFVLIIFGHLSTVTIFFFELHQHE